MNSENIQKHLVKVNSELSQLAVNSLAQALAQANAKIEELEKELAELKKPKEEPKA